MFKWLVLWICIKTKQNNIKHQINRLISDKKTNISKIDQNQINRQTGKHQLKMRWIDEWIVILWTSSEWQMIIRSTLNQQIWWADWYQINRWASDVTNPHQMTEITCYWVFHHSINLFNPHHCIPDIIKSSSIFSKSPLPTSAPTSPPLQPYLWHLQYLPNQI